MFVKLWMTKDPVTVKVDQPVAAANLCLQENRIRRIPVVNDTEQLIGIVSREDIFNVMPSAVDGSSAGSQSLFAESTKVSEIMTPNPMFVEPMTSLETVAKSMRKHKIGGMPVVENDTLVGIITESDIFLAFMEILGVNQDGVRIEMIISKKTEDFYTILEIFKRYKISILAVTFHNDYGPKQRLLTMKITGDELDSTLNALRKSGVQINSIQEEDNAF